MTKKLLALPERLKLGNHFVCWRTEVRDGKPTKVPYYAHAHGGNLARAASTKPETWSDFAAALEACEKFRFDGVGRVLTEEDGLSAVDLDACIDSKGGIDEQAGRIITMLDSYTEITPSGVGLRVWVEGKLPRGSRCRKGKVEIYSRDRYLTLTGDHLPGFPETVEARQAELEKVHTFVFGRERAANDDNFDRGNSTSTSPPPSPPRSARPPDDDILRRALASGGFKKLLDGDLSDANGDDSVADEKFCCHLARFTRDPAQIDRLLRRSALMRDKWNRGDYRERTIARALQFVRVAVPEAEKGWPDPQPLGAELPAVPDFNPDLLPTSLRPMVEDVAERMQAPIDYAAVAAIVALAGCVNRRARIQPKVEDTEWSVVPNLWGAIIGPPGYMKSPVLRQLTQPLVRIEELWRAEFEAESESFEYVKEQAELRHQAWREQYKVAIKKGAPGPVQPDASLVPPVQRRLIVTDATFERLHEILEENPAGVTVVRDELTGWLADLEKQGRESERGFYLQSWNGDGGFTVDRIGRGLVYVPAVCVSLVGNIQPSRLRWYLSEMIRGGPADDGLFQRFQIMAWPDPPRAWKLVDRGPNAMASAAAEKIYRGLAGLSADSPVHLRFSTEAQEFFFSWWAELESTKVRGESHLHPTLVAHLSKYRSLMPSLAALFELADRAAAQEITDEPLIALSHTRRAMALCDYLESHAHRVYSCIVTPELQAAHELCRHIRRGDLNDEFTTRTIYRKGWAGLDSTERVQLVLDLLEDAGWVRPATASPSAAGGRPSEIWLLNPKLGQRNPIA